MHPIFYDSTLNIWRLIITEKLPEKPRLCDFPYDERSAFFRKAIQDYNDAIAAIKQNALTVGNPEICPQNMSAVEPGKFYEWIGGYETKEIPGIPTYSPSKGTEHNSQTVAILTLPEEKKNTMENEERRVGYNKEFLTWIYERMVNVHGENDMYDYMINFKYIIDQVTTASGSVAAPKEEETSIQKSIIPFLLGEDSYDGYWWGQEPHDRRPPFWWRTKLREEVEPITDLQIKNAALEMELAAAKEALKELLPIAERKFNSISIDDAASHREYIALKAIIERARKLISK